MNIERLKAAELAFLARYPGGFANPELVEIGKKHQVANRVKQTQSFFSSDAFATPQVVVENMLKTISRSSLVSTFEKMRLRDWVKTMTLHEREAYALALHDMLHGDQEFGFGTMVSLLQAGKLAKWPLITVIPFYFSPLEEVLVKPTTVKNIVRYFELTPLVYQPAPTYSFYTEYRRQFLEMKRQADPSLQKDNGAFSGFLMMMTSQQGDVL
ncbi:hypothetical protein HGP28_03875 [Vibrio sp. SM6]|uniref:Uncharacterized protein n=1 Tax=Vibrio agarilyticus TaxID=2726741 RepID=A0A7X8TNX2_9VIBR|nr:hypothetical protein [Vibrio agarilyticus]NLS12030.1 hypothetical protein [Vibrio agarilyticus]